MSNITATSISSKLTADEKATIRANIGFDKGVRDYNAYIESIFAKATLDLNFAKNEHKAYEAFGPVNKLVTDAITTARNSTATYQGPIAIASAAINIPRIAYDPVTGIPLGLLTEEQRTNVCLQSKDFATTWNQNPDASVDVTSNAITAPDGTLTADKFIEANTAVINHDLYQNFTFTAGTTYTFSMFVKAAERTRGSLAFGIQTAFTTERRVLFDLVAKTAVAVGAGATAGIQEHPNGWFLVWVTAAADATGASPYYVRLLDGSSNATYAGVVGSGFFVSDSQLEVGNAPTSRIQTTTAQLTRIADVINRALAITNENAGSIFIEFNLTSYNKSGNTTIVGLNGSSQAFERGFALTVDGNIIQGWMRNATDNKTAAVVLSDSLIPIKALVSFDNITKKLLLTVNGVTNEQTITSAIDISSFVSNIYISGGFRIAGAVGVHSKIVKRCAYFPCSIPVAEAQAVTL